MNLKAFIIRLSCSWFIKEGIQAKAPTSEGASGDVLWKNMFLKIMNTYLEEHLRAAASVSFWFALSQIRERYSSKSST